MESTPRSSSSKLDAGLDGSKGLRRRIQLTTLESGNTYAVFCFIQDRAGGPPHAVAYDMFEVFEVP